MSILKQINNKNYINGKWLESDNNFQVTNPYSHEIIGAIPNMPQSMIEESIQSAHTALSQWKAASAEYRAELLMKWYNLIIQKIDELALLLTTEQGKALNDARSEILYGASFVKFSAESANKVVGSCNQGTKPNQQILIEHEAVGVVGAITPWNFPSAMITRKVAPALAVGCTVIVKPSELTPFSALALASLAEQAGIPAGVINIITADAALVGDIFSKSKLVKKISFTGSTRVGKILYEKSANNLHKLALELGGNAPFIICEDCDIEKALPDLIAAKIRSSGQACTSPNRIFIHENIYDNFIRKLKTALEHVKSGSGIEQGVDIGPLINQAAIDKIMRLINDATDKGAQITLGGSPIQGTLLPATIISDCRDDMEIFAEEIFGPVFACYKFDSLDEVISRSNNTNYGLASYLYTSNLHTAFKIKDKLDFAMVAINEPVISSFKGAFGGRNDSGFGIEGSHLGLYEFTIPKYTLLGY